jgi:tetratricopeptide (TPR) repeat protein
MPQVIEEKYSWYEAPQEVKDLLFLASENWEDTNLAEKYINQALALAGKNINVLIGAYRFFFYKAKPAIALQIAQKVLQLVQQEENLPTDWSELQPILIARKNDLAIRLYIHAYSAQGFLYAKLGDIEAAKLITERVKEIDSSREFCATTVFEVLTQEPEEED